MPTFSVAYNILHCILYLPTRKRTLIVYLLTFYVIHFREVYEPLYSYMLLILMREAFHL